MTISEGRVSEEGLAEGLDLDTAKSRRASSSP